MAPEDWDGVKGGWRCPALEIPGVEVRGMYVEGRVVDPASYSVLRELHIVRWSLGNPPRLAALHLEAAKPLSTQELTSRWKKLAIVLPVVGSLTSVILTAAWKTYFDAPVPASERSNDGGLSVYLRSNDFLASGGPLRFDSLLGNTKREAWFLGTTFYISIDTHRELIRKKLSEGVDVNFIIFDPYGKRASEVARMLDIGPNELMDQCLLGIRTMIKLADEPRGTRVPGELRIKLIDDVIHSRLYLFDPKAPDGVTYFIPQINQSNSQMLPGFAARNSQSTFTSAYFEGVLRTWNSNTSIALQEWRALHPDVH